ncbi:hypothetical protein [Acetobacterium sp.]|uniref:hypothetical protein n=1 Tax=Acetobacterium sp. TaxID=1872094 RepID=UPI003593C924
MKETVLIINIATLVVTLFLVYVSYRHRRDKGGYHFYVRCMLLLSWVAGSTI